MYPYGLVIMKEREELTNMEVLNLTSFNRVAGI
jgi:hypothetical protein